MTKDVRSLDREDSGGRSAGRALVENGVTDLFGVHGYINPAIEEACRLGANMWHFRHEQSAAFAAEAYGRIAKKPGVVFTSASAGMANVFSGFSQGFGTRSPMLLLNGQHGTASDGMDTLQEGYAAEAFKTVTKWTKRVTDWQLNGHWIQRGLLDSMQYPPGPVVLEFPWDNLWATGPRRQRKYVEATGLPELHETQADPARLEVLAQRLLASERPLIVAGDGIYWSEASEELVALAELLDAPTNARRTARGAISEEHRLACAAGYRQPMLLQADLVVIIGVRPGELESWFEPPAWPVSTKYVQIQACEDEIWRGLKTEASVIGTSRLVLTQLLDILRRDLGDSGVQRPEWIGKLTAARESFKARRVEERAKFKQTVPIHTFELGAAIAAAIPENTRTIFDSYSGSIYLTDALTARYAGQVVDSGPKVPLGQSVGMAIGSLIADPDTPVITLIGDGGLGISGMDLETLVRYDLPATVVLLNNSSWGGQTLNHSALGGDIGSWDITPGLRYDKMFAELGCWTAHVDDVADLEPTIRAAMASGRPALVNVVADDIDSRSSTVWMRAKAMEYYAKGVDPAELPEDTLAEFAHMRPIEVLRTHKAAVDAGLDPDLGWLSQLTGNNLDDVLELATKAGYEHGQ